MTSRAPRILPPGSRIETRGCTAVLLSAAIAAIVLLGCAGTVGRGESGSGSPLPPSPITVTVQPASATLFLGQSQQFQATVSGTSNASVNWTVDGVAGGNSAVGTISAAGLYTAPGSLPANPIVNVSAASTADSTATSSATVTLHDDIVVSVSPASASVPAGGVQVFTATVTASGSPAPGVTWSVNGIAGGNGSVGTIAAGGANSASYTAPAAPPSPPNVTITATSVADTAKSATASVTVTCGNLISPASATLSLGQMQTFTASLCVAIGTPIAWDVNGIAGGNANVGTIVGNPASGATNAAIYTAPADLPSTNPLTIHATAGGMAASAAVTISSAVSVTVSPPSATVGVSQRATFAANVTNSPDTAVTWSVNGVPNGNPAVGEICIVASNPCVSPNGAISGSVDYVAPVDAPTVNPVTLTATSEADTSGAGTAIVFVAAQTGPISVSISPAYAFVVPSAIQPSTMQFAATVSGTNLSSVTWSVQSAVAGQGCGGAACGSIDANGLFTAPSGAPSPNGIAVIATSVADPTKSATATVAITSGPTITVLLPSSVMAGAVEGFPFEVQGVNFVAGSSSAGTGSVILLDGQPRSTTCATAGACTTVLNPSDVQAAATITVQIRNPGSPGALSNPAAFVIVPFDVSTGTIALDESQPAGSGQNLVVVEPTTAAASSPINVDFIGLFSAGNCGVQGSPLAITRPSSGTATVSLCVHGTGLDPTFTHAFTGPNGGADIGVVASAVTGLFPNTIELDLTISNATLPGVRSLFITTLNNDRAVATGMLEVK